MKKFLTLLSLLNVAVVHASDKVPNAETTDWMVNPIPFKASIIENKADRELVLSNGLARRVIRLYPNAATIDLQNLTSGERYLRAIAPEARVKLNGKEYEIGGLSGARIANYIDAAGLDTLVTSPQAYRFTGYEVGETQARFAWKKRPEWMAKDLPWPPPGQHVVMRYSPPTSSAITVTKALVGAVIIDQNFSSLPYGTQLNEAWKELKDPTFERSSFYNEGKVGEVMSASAGTASIERAWPADAKSVEILMDSGSDTSGAWGPGMALIRDKEVTRFITRPADKKYEVSGTVSGSFNPSRPCRLRLRLEKGTAICEAAQDSANFTTIATIPYPNPPIAIRFGKIGLNGSGTDSGNDKTMVRSHISQVTWRGSEPEQPAVVPHFNLPNIEIHYELYDGIPLMQKWLEIINTTTSPVMVNRFVAEELRIAENEMSTNAPPTREKPNLYVETDYAFGDMSPYSANSAVTLETDPKYPTQVNYPCKSACLLKAQPPMMGPDVAIKPEERFTSFRTFILLQDSSERERRTLAQRRMYRTVAPWTAQNPFMFHKVQSDPVTVKAAIDEAASVGFEMVIMSFGSGFNHETRDPAYIAKYKELSDYGKSKGITLGGYSLLASRGAGKPEDNTQNQPTAYGRMPCLGAKWGNAYLETIRNMIDKTGFGVFENDGSYPGDRCAATNHPFHRGLEDSQWVQWRAMTQLYQWCTANGVYLNIPDWYFLAGSHKTAMHYRESNYGLPRAQQIIIERQNMFDGTWEKCASQGWMLIPLSSYTGGAESTIEPLDQHRDHYNERFADLIGFGVQACFRGPRLYDSPETKAIVKKWVDLYKSHREVLDGDIIHLRRANGLDWDGILHVNPQGKEKAMAFLYNPLTKDIQREIRLPLYYTGLSEQARAKFSDGTSTEVKLDHAGAAIISVKIPASSHSWILFTK